MRLIFILLYFLLSFNSFSQNLKWIYRLGGVQNDVATALTIDKNDNVVDVNIITGISNVAPNLNFISRGGEDILIRKSTDLGVRQWVKQISSGSSVFSKSIANDQNNNIFVVGTFSDSLFFDGVYLFNVEGNRQFSFLLKLDPNGNLLWARRIFSSMSVHAFSIAVDEFGDVSISGNFSGTVQFGSGVQSISVGGNDIFLAKFNGVTSDPLFARSVGGLFNENLQKHVVDKDNNHFLIGEFRDSLDLNPGVSSNYYYGNGITNVFVTKWSPAGSFIWGKSIGGLGISRGSAIQIDHLGDAIVAGSFTHNILFDTALPEEISKGETDIFLCKLGGLTGEVKWAQVFGDTLSDAAAVLTVNSQGIIYFGGMFRGVMDLNPSFDFVNEISSNGGSDVFVAILNQDGTYNGHYTLGGIANDIINDLKVNTKGEVVTCGGFGAIVDFDPTSGELRIFSSGGQDAFLWNVFVCINSQVREIIVEKLELCRNEKLKIYLKDGSLNGASQWSWSKNDCDNLPFASGDTLNIAINDDVSIFFKGFGGCIGQTPCIRFDVKKFKDSLIYNPVVICQGSSITIGSNTYNQSGVYQDTLVSTAGCDSVVITELIVNPSYTVTNNFEICIGDTIWVGQNFYTVSGRYIDLLTSSLGCDSIVISNVVVKPNLVLRIDTTICKGDTLIINNRRLFVSGLYVIETPASNGCNDFTIINLTVADTLYTRFISICEGEDVVVGSNIYNVTGVYIDRLISSLGCDSVIVTNLNVLSVNHINQTFRFCFGDSVVVGNSVYRIGGTYMDTLQNAFGCDSIITTTLVPNPMNPVLFLDRSICSGERFFVGDKVYNQSGIYIDTLFDSNGCDSIIHLNLTVIPKFYSLGYEICEGSSLTFGDIEIATTGQYTFEYKNQNDCDSIVIIDLIVNPIKKDTNYHAICPGDVVIVGTSIYRNDGFFVDRLATQFGCDSTVVSIITYDNKLIELDTTLCEGATITINGKDYSSPGIFQQDLTADRTCDSILQIKIVELPRYNIDTTFTICRGGSVVVGGNTYFNSGKYIELLTSSRGCDSLINFNVEVINFIPVINIKGDTLKTPILENASYQWYECDNGILIPYLGATEPYFVLLKKGVYALEITFMGCTYSSGCIEFGPSSTNDEIIDIKFYPNPVHDKMTIVSEKYGELFIHNIHGVLLKKQPVQQGFNVVDFSNMTPGVYLISVRTELGFQTMKLIKE